MIVAINNSKYLDIKLNDFMDEFKKLLGQPYAYGGDGTLKECQSSSCGFHKKGTKYKGYDCSGYVYSVLSKWNYNKFGRSTSQMQSSNGYGKWISNKNDLKVGDLIFFNGHVGVISKKDSGGVYMYHSPKCGKYVEEINVKYRDGFTKGLRVLKSNLEDISQVNKNETPVRGNEKVFYRVCVASYEDKANADKMIDELKLNGYNSAFISTYIKEEK